MAIKFKSASDTFESLKAFLQSITTKLTDFNVGSILSNLFDTFSQEIGNNVYVTLKEIYDNIFIKTSYGTGLDNRVADFTLSRKLKTKATGTVIFGRNTAFNQDFLIAIGTIVQTQSSSNINGVQFQVIENKILPANELSIDVAVEALEAGLSGNVNAGTVNVILNPPAGIEYAVNTLAFSGGTDDESDDDLKARVPLFLQSLSRGTKDSLISIVSAVPGVKTVSITEPDPPSGIFNVLIDDGSGTASSSLIKEVKDALNGTGSYSTAYKPITTQANVLAPIKMYVNINASIEITGTFLQIQTNVITALSSFLSTLKVAEKVKRADIIRIIKEVSGVVNMDTINLEINANKTQDLIIADNYVARTGTITISEI